jgi:hypothetical protein
MLDEVVAGETVRGRAIAVVRSRRLEELKTCHLVFVGNSERGRTAQIISALREASALTVSDLDGFARHGGIVNFFFEGKKSASRSTPPPQKERG